MSEIQLASDWWKATDERWYPPPHPWQCGAWLASDGDWYPHAPPPLPVGAWSADGRWYLPADMDFSAPWQATDGWWYGACDRPILKKWRLPDGRWISPVLGPPNDLGGLSKGNARTRAARRGAAGVAAGAAIFLLVSTYAFLVARANNMARSGYEDSLASGEIWPGRITGGLVGAIPLVWVVGLVCCRFWTSSPRSATGAYFVGSAAAMTAATIAIANATSDLTIDQGGGGAVVGLVTGPAALAFAVAGIIMISSGFRRRYHIRCAWLTHRAEDGRF